MPYWLFTTLYTSRFVFGLTALLPLITSGVAVLVKEQPIRDSARGQNLSLQSSAFYETSRNKIIQLWATVKQPNVFLPTLFLFLWQATPQSDSAMFFFMYVSDLIFEKFFYSMSFHET